MSMVRTHVSVRGMVQGVYFRAHIRDKATAHNVTGWVKNRNDGGVEAVFEGRNVPGTKYLRCYPGSRIAQVFFGFL